MTCDMVNKLHLSDPMQVNKLLFIQKRNIVYDIPDDNQDGDEVNAEEMDNSVEIPIVSASSALKAQKMYDCLCYNKIARVST